MKAKIKSAFMEGSRFVKKLGEDAVGAYAAQSAFFIILSFFPFIMLLLTLLQYLPFSQQQLSHFTLGFLPSDVDRLVQSVIGELYSKASGTVISLTAIVALWSAAKGIMALTKGFNAVYDIPETRGYFRLRLRAMLYTLAFVVILIVTLGFLVFGSSIYHWLIERIPSKLDMALRIISLRSLVGFVLLAVFFLLMYLFLPNRRSRIRDELPGAMVSAAGWLVFSYIYSYYIEHIGNFSYLYGSLTAVVLLILWLYFCMYILFFGAELNVFLKQRLGGIHLLRWFRRRNGAKGATEDTSV